MDSKSVKGSVFSSSVRLSPSLDLVSSFVLLEDRLKSLSLSELKEEESKLARLLLRPPPNSRVFIPRVQSILERRPLVEPLLLSGLFVFSFSLFRKRARRSFLSRALWLKLMEREEDPIVAFPFLLTTFLMYLPPPGRGFFCGLDAEAAVMLARRGEVCTSGAWMAPILARRGDMYSLGACIMLVLARRGDMYSLGGWMRLVLARRGDMYSSGGWVAPILARRGDANSWGGWVAPVLARRGDM